jgi:hypothetical protein
LIRLFIYGALESSGRPLADVFHVVNSETRDVIVDPLALAIQDNKPVSLSDCILIRRDGMEYAIEDSATPIHDLEGKIAGAVMVFHDVMNQDQVERLPSQ